MAEKTLTKKSEKELHKMLKEARDALHAFRFGSAGSRVRNTKEGRELRRRIARILTELNRRVKSGS